MPRIVKNGINIIEMSNNANEILYDDEKNGFGVNTVQKAIDKLVQYSYNTMHGEDVIDNLNSTSTVNPLSANQGRELKILIDSKSDINHTHNYAASSTVGGAANSANKLNSNAGSETNPIYFNNGIPVACSYSLNKSVPSNAVFTDTWRDIQDNLTSTSNTDSLSANQGKILKDLVDTKADINHTHNYAASSTIGGAANSANKLNTDAGSTTNPIYFKNGIPVACKYTLEKSVPSNAVFTDTWRGIQDNLTSTSTTDSLSANQGKILKDLVDTKASVNHTHNYATGSNDGSAASADKLNSNAGSVNIPIYFNNGVPLSCESSGKLSLSTTSTTTELNGKSILLNGQTTVNNNLIIGSVSKLKEINLYGTMNITNGIIENGRNSIWVNGRDTAVLYQSTINGYCTLISTKTNNGSWDIGVTDNNTFDDRLLFSYITDSQYSTKGSEFKPQIKFKKDGYIEANLNGIADSANKLNTNDGSDSNPVYFKNGIPVHCAYELNKTVPSNAVFTDTWRPVVDSLTSTYTTHSLSANQGKILKDLVDTNYNYITALLPTSLYSNIGSVITASMNISVGSKSSSISIKTDKAVSIISAISNRTGMDIISCIKSSYNSATKNITITFSCDTEYKYSDIISIYMK